MSKLMLIDAAHPEETRVSLVSKGQVEDFDFETAGKEQLRGSIYLAKVTRVEPSLQAAFVEYGGNRHGFLAFSEIHPDYYQLPQADREAILREAAEAAAEDDGFDIDDDDEDDDDENESDAAADDDGDDPDNDADDSDGEPEGATDDVVGDGESTDETVDLGVDDEPSGDDEDTAGEGTDSKDESPTKRRGRSTKAETNGGGGRGRQARKRPARNSYLKKYKIQEVIRRRQVMLVQVVKEERGNKGAALTTYLSLAGRYSVLMPNTPRGGGISRKIASSTDRRRLKSVMNELDLPPGMGLIVRTAGAKRTKTEIKRDYDYLLKLWDNIRSKTMESIAPCSIHEEGGLVHRAMRDMFEKEVEQVWIQGDAAYREAKDLAKLLMPTQAKKVQAWDDPVPLFVEHGVDKQLESIFSPTVQLKSGGYLVINQTEALVAIDVNSGRATKARNIEQTALKTNLEAAEEACRQMRLRDLAGLVVIDFIDMDEAKNNRAVENKVKDCLKADRARVQYGRISQFGLMEISRQRRRAGILQASSEVCDACNGTGRRRSVDSAALQLLRAIESRAAGGDLKSMRVEAPTDVALYLLNIKREAILHVESAMGVVIQVTSSAHLIAGDFTIEVEKDPDAPARSPKRARPTPKRDTSAELDVIDADEDDAVAVEDGGDADAGDPAKVAEDSDSDGNGDGDGEDQPKRRRRRGRRGGRRRRRGGAGDAGADGQDGVEPVPMKQTEPDAVPEDGGAFLDGLSLSAKDMLGEEIAEPAVEAAPEIDTGQPGDAGAGAEAQDSEPEIARSAAETSEADGMQEPEKTAPDSSPVPDADNTDTVPEAVAAAPAETSSGVANDDAPKELDNRVPAAAVTAATDAVSAPLPTEPSVAGPDDPDEDAPSKPKRAGWWNRRRA